MPTPTQLVVGSLDLYLAPEGEAQPADAGTTPAGNWSLLGTAGDEDYGEEGVKVVSEQTINDFHTLGSTGAVKATRSRESLMISMVLHDMLPAQVSLAWNANAVTDAGDFDWFGTRKGTVVQTRGVWAVSSGTISPAGAFKIAWYIPKASNVANVEIVYNKDTLNAVRCEWKAYEYRSASTAAERFGRLIVDEA